MHLEKDDSEVNISYSLEEPVGEPHELVTYNELLRQVDLLELTSNSPLDDYMANEVHYSTNYTRKELDHIADYYSISKRKKRKDEIVQDIVIFEHDPENIDIVYRRKRLWSYIKEIKDDKYLRKFLIFN